MNKTRQKATASARGKLEEIKQQVEDLKSEIESHGSDETEYYDNMPESIQGGEKGDISQAASEKYDEAVSALDSAVDELGTAIDALTEIENA